MTEQTPDLVSEVRRLAASHQALVVRRDAARDRLRDAVLALVESGHVSEAEAARMAGVSRQGLRQWLGKQDRQNRPLRGT